METSLQRLQAEAEAQTQERLNAAAVADDADNDNDDLAVEDDVEEVPGGQPAPSDEGQTGAFVEQSSTSFGC